MTPSAEPNTRVLVVAPEPVYEDRGTPIAVRQLLDALTQLGYPVDLLTYPVGAPVDLPGLRIRRAPNPLRLRRVPIGLSWRKLALDVTLTTELLRLVRRGRYSCIHAVEEAAFPAVVLGRRLGLPVVYDMQSSLPEQLDRYPLFRRGPLRSLTHAMERWVLRRADFVVTSAGLAARVRRSVPEARVREWQFASHGPAASPAEIAAVRQELDLPADARVVLYSGTFAHYQGIPDLLRAVPAVRARVPRAVFVMVGARDGEIAELAEEAAPLVAEGSVRLVGRQPRQRMPAFLGMADVLVSARLYGDNLPLKIFDYLAARRPIVATDIPAHRAVLDSTRARLVGRRAEDLAEGLVEVLTDPEHAARLADGAAGFALDRLGWAGFVDSVALLYEEVHATDGRG